MVYGGSCRFSFPAYQTSNNRGIEAMDACLMANEAGEAVHHTRKAAEVSGDTGRVDVVCCCVVFGFRCSPLDSWVWRGLGVQMFACFGGRSLDVVVSRCGSLGRRCLGILML